MSAPRVDDDAKRRNRAQALVFILFPIVLNLGLKAQRDSWLSTNKENERQQEPYRARFSFSLIILWWAHLLMAC